MTKENIEMYRAMWGQHRSDAEMRYNIYCLGDIIKKQIKCVPDGIDAIAVYLSQRDRIPVEKTFTYKTDYLYLLLDNEIRSNDIASVDFLALRYDQSNSREGARWRLLEANAALNYLADCFGDKLAETEEYKGVRGEEALRLYVMKKYGWLPSDVYALSIDALRFLINTEMKDWKPTTLQSSVINI